jgi:hypothetical protein
MPLQEFSKIVILKDTPETRFVFGPPIKESDVATANIGAYDPSNVFYTRLVGTGINMINGWRQDYPDFDIPLTTAVDPAAGTVNGFASRAIRNNFLQAMTDEEEGLTYGYNRPPKSAGTAIIFGDKLYVGDVGGDFGE